MTRPCPPTGCGAQIRASVAPPSPLTADQRRERIRAAIGSCLDRTKGKPERPRPWQRRRVGR